MMTKRFSKMHTSFTIVMSILCFLPQCSNSGTPEELSSASEVVRQFCELDLNGARLSSKSYPAIRSLIAYENEPGWDRFDVVSNYKIYKPYTRNGQLYVEVGYQVLGIVNSFRWTSSKDSLFVPEPPHNFHLIKFDDQWKIAKPVMHPHLSIQTAMNLLRSYLEEYTNGQRSDGQENVLKLTIAALEELNDTIKPSDQSDK